MAYFTTPSFATSTLLLLKYEKYAHFSKSLGVAAGAAAGSRWHDAVARVVNLVATSNHGAKSLPHSTIVAVEELQTHIMHAENFRTLAEGVIVR